jgi:ferredoxin
MPLPIDMPVSLPQIGRVVEATPGVDLLTLLVNHGVPLARSCSGAGVCGTCRVKIRGSHLPQPSVQEKQVAKKNGFVDSAERLACLLAIPSANIDWVVETTYW